MRILYLDCFSGISGDMTLASLVDAGADRAYIEAELQKIAVEPFSLEWRRVDKNGISSLKMDVVVPEEHHHAHHHRHYADIVKLIKEAGLDQKAVEYSLAIFAKIGEAEAKIHNIPLEKVHFHEVGAIDSIVDVVGIALAIQSLEVDRIVSAPVPLGSGTVKCDHGLYPVPAPATLELMKGLPIAPSDHPAELTTPTGAGVIAALADAFSPGLPPMIVRSVGYGAGTRNLPNRPNVLRTVIGDAESFTGSYVHGLGHVREHEHHGHGHDHGHHHGHHHHHDHEHDHHHHDHHDHEHHHHHDHHEHRHNAEDQG